MQSIRHLPQLDGELGWFETAPNRDRVLGAPLKSSQRFDVVIIGAGFTGLAVAHRLAELEPGVTIAVVDALKVGQGTSGRNAGFIIDLPHNLDAGAPDVAYNQALYRLNCFAIERLRHMRDQFAIDCLWHDAGKYMTAHETANLGGLTAFTAILDACGFAYESLAGEALARRLGTAYYQQAVYTPGNVLMNPSALVRGVAAGLSGKATLFEDSPVVAVESSSRGHRIRTVGGELHAERLVHATNSFAEEFGVVRQRLAPVFTYGSLTDPLTEAQYESCFSGVRPWGLTSAHPAGTTVRLTPDRRILIRNTLDFNPSLGSHASQRAEAWRQHRRSFEARFPSLVSVAFRHTWGGMLCMTRNHESVFQRVDARTYVVSGCNGVGVAKGSYLGYYLADLMAGHDSETLQFIRQHNQAAWIPPDPLRALAARWRLRRESAQAGGDI
ncbi:NAD(P)/FAD-dependent oxidoreductase [Bordetella trematum]|uniref:NAD(P)/FAD-dependent oxidoreductase n=1 Tax=Bordetella trematum TaxID=123899 RepID=UPI003AF3569D